MKFNPYQKGRELEDVVEQYLKLLGSKYRRNVRIRGLSGAIHEVDFLVYLGDNRKEIIEVKNLERPVGKEVVMKVSELINDIGAHKATIVSSGGFTSGAASYARKLGIKLMDIDEILKSIEVLSKEGHIKKVLEPSYNAETAAKYARKFLKKRFIFVMKEKISEVDCIRMPFYIIFARKAVSKKEEVYYEDMNLLSSAYTGLLLARRRGVLYEVGEKAQLVPPDVLDILTKHQGRCLYKREISPIYGESFWRKIRNVVKLLDIGEVRRVGKESCVFIKKFIPSHKDLRMEPLLFNSMPSHEIARTYCRDVEPRVSPGSVRLFVETIIKVSVQKIELIYLPLYRIKVVTNEGIYRYLYLTAWTKKPLLYRASEDVLDL